MQKDVFDDIFDTTDDDKTDEDDDVPVIPTPSDFQVNLRHSLAGEQYNPLINVPLSSDV